MSIILSLDKIQTTISRPISRTKTFEFWSLLNIIQLCRISGGWVWSQAGEKPLSFKRICTRYPNLIININCLGQIDDDTLSIKRSSPWWRHEMETFYVLLALFLRGIHRPPVNSHHKCQWQGALMFSLICAWINRWVNNREAGDLRRHRIHYDVTVMHHWRGVWRQALKS